MDVVILILLVFNTLCVFFMFSLLMYNAFKTKKEKKVDPVEEKIESLRKFFPVITISEKELNEELLRCLENEEYERASHVRDLLNKIKRNRDDIS